MIVRSFRERSNLLAGDIAAALNRAAVARSKLRVVCAVGPLDDVERCADELAEALRAGARAAEDIAAAARSLA